MARFACVVLLTVVVTVVISNSTVPSNDTIVSMVKPITFQNVTENFTAEAVRVSPGKPNMSWKRLKPVEETKKFQMLLENSLPREKSNREVNSVNDFWKKRNALADSEVQKLLGNRISLDANEVKANKIILSKKYEEYDKYLSTTEKFPPSISFFQAKPLIEQSDIYKIIKKMPKGGNIYNMLLTCVDLDFMYEMTFEDNLYFDSRSQLQIKFSKTRPAPGWRLLSQLRDSNDAEYVENLNRIIQDSLTLNLPNSEEANEVAYWHKYLEVLRIYGSMLSYKPILEKIYKKTLEILYEDNIRYAEIGYDFPEVYDLDGKTYSPEEVLRLCKSFADDFIRTHKDFIGVRFVYVIKNPVTRENLINSRKIVTYLWNSHLIAGFSFVRMTETEKPFSYWVEELLKFPNDTNLFLDSGMTKHWGTNADYDLLDAITLGPTSIGLGFAFNKHPVVLEELRKQEVPVKFSPIAAQAMHFVEDLRNHPLAHLVALDSPMVIGNAGGTVWNATGLSYDWYAAYMAMTPRFCDLRCLKQFAFNSWLYCTLPTEVKKKSIRAWHLQWNKFIDYIIYNYD